MKSVGIFTAMSICFCALIGPSQKYHHQGFAADANAGHIPAGGPDRSLNPSSTVIPTEKTATTQLMFDDFNYVSHAELAKHGWIIRTAAGWPGVPGAAWGADGISLQADSSRPGNRLLRMTSSTDGTGEHTRQAQICHERKYLEGTYAARVRFTDKPVSGPNGDQIVESFYAISPLKAPMDPDYSELDFEYLPNGGWGIPGSTFYETTWETFSPEPNWKADNVSNHVSGTKAGWHTLVIQVADARVRYFVDGNLQVEHGERFFPESLMSINFNLWFIKEGLTQAEVRRSYEEDIDWVLFQKGDVLSPSEVETLVQNMRRKPVKFIDTVAKPVPALTSPCNF